MLQSHDCYVKTNKKTQTNINVCLFFILGYLLLTRWWPSASMAVPGSAATRIFTSRAAVLWVHPLPCAVQNTSHKQPAPPPTPWTPPPLNKALSAKKLFSDHSPNKDSGQTSEGISGCRCCSRHCAVQRMSAQSNEWLFQLWKIIYFHSVTAAQANWNGLILYLLVPCETVPSHQQKW